MITSFALALTSLMGADLSLWTGNYSCLGDDTSEIFDRYRSRGHDYFDLDGDTSDPGTIFGMRVEPASIFVQNVFTNRATPTWTRFRFVETKRTAQNQSVVGVAFEGMTDRPQTLVIIRDGSTGRFGLFMSVSRYSVPALLDGEAVVIADLRLAHCNKR